MPTVHCIKLGKEGEALDRAPFKNELGERILAQVSKEGWKEWLKHSTMLINEYLRGTALTDKKAQDFLLKQCEEFFFGTGGAKPEGYVAPGVQGDAAAEPAPSAETPNTDTGSGQ